VKPAARRAWVLWWLLRRRSHPCKSGVGVRNTAGGFEAHAWVEIGSTVVNDGQEVRNDYAPFDQDIAAACKGAR